MIGHARCGMALSRSANLLTSQKTIKQSFSGVRSILSLNHLDVENLTQRKFSQGISTRVISTPDASPSPSIGQLVASLAEKFPNMDVLRYDHKNVKWSFKHIDHYADCVAIGLLEQGLQPGDAMLSWLPKHFCEQHVLQLACSKAGFILYELDPSQAINDKEGAKKALKKALEDTEATCLFSQEAGDSVNYVQLCREVIPEIRIFDFQKGMPFFTPRFPNLRFPIHTGFEMNGKEGMLALKHLVVPSGEMNNLLGDVKISGETPLRGELKIGSDGLPMKGAILSNNGVIKAQIWPEISAMIEKKYTEVEGVGVVF